MRAFVLTAATAVLVAGPAWSQSPEPPAGGYLDPEKSAQAQQMLRESIEKMLDAMGLFIQSIPQYEEPEITPEGDIIIRRKNPITPRTPIPSDPLEKDST
jgi:hypothetical protein